MSARVVWNLAVLQPDTPAVLTIGAFDGVHRGHRYLVNQAIDRARSLGLPSVVLTFDPDPMIVLRPSAGACQLTGGREKAAMLVALGPNWIVVHPFTVQFSQLSADDFLALLIAHIAVRELWIGADFAMGHNREGDVAYFSRASKQHGFATHVVPRQSFDDMPVSSTRIRQLLRAGEIERAIAVLGHFPTLAGTVTRGAGRGTKIGYPTANITPSPTRVLPALGIYAALAEVGEEIHPAAVSVGVRPTFNETSVVVEAYLMDFVGSLAGKELTLHFVKRLRGEVKFATVADLVGQMDNDIEQARDVLSEVNRALLIPTDLRRIEQMPSVQ